MVGGLNRQLPVKLRGYPEVKPATKRLGRYWLRHGFAGLLKFIDDIGHQAFNTAECFELIFVQPRQRRELKNSGNELLVLWRPLHRVSVAQPGTARLLFEWASTSPCCDRWGYGLLHLVRLSIAILVLQIDSGIPRPRHFEYCVVAARTRPRFAKTMSAEFDHVAEETFSGEFLACFSVLSMLAT